MERMREGGRDTLDIDRGGLSVGSTPAISLTLLIRVKIKQTHKRAER